MKVTKYVLITHNPFHGAIAQDVVGRVVKSPVKSDEPDDNMVYVKYQHPATGKHHTMPFGLCNIEPADPNRLNELAQLYATKAEQLETMAKKITEEVVDRIKNGKLTQMEKSTDNTRPAELMEVLEFIRQSGLTNMFDHPEVCHLASEFGYPEVALWLSENRKAYSEILLGDKKGI